MGKGDTEKDKIQRSAVPYRCESITPGFGGERLHVGWIGNQRLSYIRDEWGTTVPLEVFTTPPKPPPHLLVLLTTK